MPFTLFVMPFFASGDYFAGGLTNGLSVSRAGENSYDLAFSAECNFGSSLTKRLGKNQNVVEIWNSQLKRFQGVIGHKPLESFLPAPREFA